MTTMFRNRKIQRSLMAMLLATMLVACSENEKASTEEKVYPVEVETIQQTSKLKQITYVGMVSSNIINYSFVMPGKIEKIWVRKNQFVTKGTNLIQLENKAYKLAVNAAKRQEKQANIAYKESSNYFEKLQGANKLGGVSKVDIEKAKLDRDIKLESWEQAKIEVRAKQMELQQTSLIAHSDGVVSEIIPKVGELIGAGSETLIIKGTGTFAETAVSQKDLEFIKLGLPAVVKIKDHHVRGKISYISKIPDFQTFRHEVKVKFSDNSHAFTLGQTARIAFETDSITGSWIPLNYISNEGSDFIYVVENDRMRKRKIQIIDFSNHLVRVSGLIENEKVITKGAYNIKEGYKVKIVKHGK